jgi:hypothetical protein
MQGLHQVAQKLRNIAFPLYFSRFMGWPDRFFNRILLLGLSGPGWETGFGLLIALQLSRPIINAIPMIYLIISLFGFELASANSKYEKFAASILPLAKYYLLK